MPSFRVGRAKRRTVKSRRARGGRGRRRRRYLSGVRTRRYRRFRAARNRLSARLRLRRRKAYRQAIARRVAIQGEWMFFKEKTFKTVRVMDLWSTYMYNPLPSQLNHESAFMSFDSNFSLHTPYGAIADSDNFLFEAYNRVAHKLAALATPPAGAVTPAQSHFRVTRVVMRIYPQWTQMQFVQQSAIASQLTLWKTKVPAVVSTAPAGAVISTAAEHNEEPLGVGSGAPITSVPITGMTEAKQGENSWQFPRFHIRIPKAWAEHGAMGLNPTMETIFNDADCRTITCVNQRPVTLRWTPRSPRYISYDPQAHPIHHYSTRYHGFINKEQPILDTTNTGEGPEVIQDGPTFGFSSMSQSCPSVFNITVSVWYQCRKA